VSAWPKNRRCRLVRARGSRAVVEHLLGAKASLFAIYCRRLLMFIDGSVISSHEEGVASGHVSANIELNELTRS